jgi:hypothetical protein
MVSAYMLPVDNIRVCVLDGSCRSRRYTEGDIKLALSIIREIHWLGNKTLYASAPFAPNAEILDKPVAEEVTEFFYRTALFDVAVMPERIERCLHPHNAPYPIRKFSVEFQYGGLEEDIAELDKLYKTLTKLPTTMDLVIVVKLRARNTGTRVHARKELLEQAIEVIFPLLELLDERGHRLTLIYKPQFYDSMEMDVC